MGVTVYHTATSLDGFIADAGNSLEWLFQVPTDEDDLGHAARFEAFLDGVGAMVMGSTTYEWVVASEQMLNHPDRWRKYHGDTPCWVFSSRELPTIDGADLRFVHGDVAPVHGAMVEAAAGKDVWVVGGGDLAGQFADSGLLDEVRLSIAPVTLGGGAPLLPRRLLAADLTLVELERQGQMIGATYRLVR